MTSGVMTLELAAERADVVSPKVVVGGVGYCRSVLRVPIRQLDAELEVPAYAHPGDAGLDLRARRDVVLRAGGGRSLVPMGVAVAIPTGYAGLLLPRSGLSLKHGITCLNSPGLIDSGYRGELKALLVNTDPEQDFKIRRGTRIAQLVVIAVAQVGLVTVETLEESSRGDQGFGSTGS